MVAEDGSNGAWRWWRGDTEDGCSTFITSQLCESTK